MHISTEGLPAFVLIYERLHSEPEKLSRDFHPTHSSAAILKTPSFPATIAA